MDRCDLSVLVVFFLLYIFSIYQKQRLCVYLSRMHMLGPSTLFQSVRVRQGACIGIPSIRYTQDRVCLYHV